MSLHADALACLSAWEAPTVAQESLRRRYLEHLRTSPDGLTRDCRPDHITASTLVLSHDRSDVLLTLHSKARRWFQLGGHCEPEDETLAGAALREATEESGIAGLVLDPCPIHLSEHAVPFCVPAAGRAPSSEVHHLDVRFLAIAAPDASHSLSEESLDLRWCPVGELPDAELGEVVSLALARAQLTSPVGGGSSRAAEDQPSR